MNVSNARRISAVRVAFDPWLVRVRSVLAECRRSVGDSAPGRRRAIVRAKYLLDSLYTGAKRRVVDSWSRACDGNPTLERDPRHTSLIAPQRRHYDGLTQRGHSHRYDLNDRVVAITKP